MGFFKQVLFMFTAALTVLIAVFFIPITQLIKKGGLFKKDFPKQTQLQFNCQSITELSSKCNNFVIHEESSTAIFVCGYNNVFSKENNPVEGNIYPVVYDIKGNSAKNIKISNYSRKEFSFKNVKIEYSEDTTKPILFFLNEIESGNVIEKFEYIPEKQEIIWKNTIKNDLIKNSSDFVPINENELFIINMFSGKPRWSKIIEAVLSKSASNVVYCDEDSICKIAAKSINGAGGIAISNDKKTVFISSSYNGKIQIYERKELTNSLRLEYTHELDFIPGKLTTLSKTNDKIYVIGYRSVIGLGRYLLSSEFNKTVKIGNKNEFKSPFVIGCLIRDSENQFYGVKYRWKTVIENEGNVNNNKKDVKSLIGISMIGNYNNKNTIVSSFDSTINPMICNNIAEK